MTYKKFNFNLNLGKIIPYKSSSFFSVFFIYGLHKKLYKIVFPKKVIVNIFKQHKKLFFKFWALKINSITLFF